MKRLTTGLLLIATTALVTCSQEPAYRVETLGPDEESGNDLADSAHKQGNDDVVANGGSPSTPIDLPLPPASETGTTATETPPEPPTHEPEGEGTEPPGGGTVSHIIESFSQAAVPRLDILFVVDNSGSMKEYQTALRHGFEDFIKRLAATTLDFQIGITSTDVCQESMPQDLAQRRCPDDEVTDPALRGALVGTNGRRVLKRGDRDLVERFQRYADLGIRGSSFEHGLTATKLAVERAVRGESETFLRRDAFLATIILSDEEDDGVGLSRANEEGVNYWQEGKTRYRFAAEELVDTLAATVPGGRFAVFPIVAVAGCGSERGMEYERASALTGGATSSICDASWPTMLADLSDRIVARVDSFRLKDRPVPGSIAVTVNGVVASRWTYRDAENLVQFERDHLPPAGAAVTVTYDTVK